MTNRIATRLLLTALPWLVVAAGTVGQVAGESTFSTACRAAWCQNDRQNDATRADSAEILEEQIATLAAGRVCTTAPRLSRSVLVLNAATDRAGRHQFDTAVVREVPFDDAFRLAESGSAWLLRYCD